MQNGNEKRDDVIIRQQQTYIHAANNIVHLCRIEQQLPAFKCDVFMVWKRQNTTYFIPIK